MRVKILFVISIFVISFGAVFLMLYFKKTGSVCFNENCFKIELAKTPEEKARGLMFRENLDQDKGMLFIYGEEENLPFTMRNTKIPLDIIWINGNEEIVFVSENSQPCHTEVCPSINPEKSAQYVLEINGGIAEKIGLEIGNKIEINF
ncbi:MAG: DUF192 domain-containing protein [Patescibacteria group bacterium]